MRAFHIGDFYGLIAARIMLGILQGPVFPSLSAFVAPWLGFGNIVFFRLNELNTGTFIFLFFFFFIEGIR